MTATVYQLHPAGPSAARYGDHVDLRDIVRRGDQIGRPWRYSADVWDLTGCPEMARGTPVIRFDRIPTRYRTVVKDTVLLLGDPALATTWAPGPAADAHAAARRGNWRTASNTARRAVSLLRLVDQLALVPLAPRDWHTLADAAKNQPQTNPQTGQTTTMSPETLGRAAHVLREMHDLAPLHGHTDPFGSRPWGLEEINAAVGHRPPVAGEHRNATRPHGHVFAMAGACINLLERCADDLIDRAAWWTNQPDTPWALDRPDPYDLAHPDQDRPGWLTHDDHLLPVANAEEGLWWWSNRLVIAAYYVVAAIVALRGREIDALTPDCLTTHDGRHTMTGVKVKNHGDLPPATTWTANDLVATAIRTVNRLRDARQLQPLTHPRFPGRPVLFSANLLAGTAQRRRTKPLLSRPIAPHSQQQWLVPAMQRLREAGAGEPVDDLQLQNHRTIRITALDVHIDRPLGDLAAAAVGKWSTTGVALGYYGHRPQITAPAWTDDVDQHRATRGVGRLLTDVAGDDPPTLTGRGADGLTAQVAADQRLANGPVSLKVLRGAVRRTHASVSIGTLAACLTPEGGLCGGKAEADHRLCQLGCRNMVLTPYHRARLELTRRSLARLLGRDSPLAAKVDDHDHLLVDEQTMTDDQLIDIVTDQWDPTFRDLVNDLLGATA